MGEPKTCHLCARADVVMFHRNPGALCDRHRADVMDGLRVRALAAVEKRKKASAGIKQSEPAPVHDLHCLCMVCLVNDTPEGKQRRHAHADARKSPPPQVYTIPARDVMQGMLYRGWNGEDRYDPGILMRPGNAAWVGIQDMVRMGRGDEDIQVSLTGPSPRELCCTCAKPPDAYLALLVACEPPLRHQSGCPVAPVEGLHGGMRLWPAPWRDTPVGWEQLRYIWTLGDDNAMSPALLADCARGEFGTLQNDAVLKAFFHPPRATFEARPRDPWCKRLGDGATPWNPEDL